MFAGENPDSSDGAENAGSGNRTHHDDNGQQCDVLPWWQTNRTDLHKKAAYGS